MEGSIGLLGGTFDRLHDGHLSLIRGIASECDFLQIHVTSDKIAREKGFFIQNLETRMEQLRVFLLSDKSINASLHVLHDKFGPAVSIEKCSVIGCTEETFSSCEEINQIREKNGLSPLRIVKIDHILDEGGEILSSSRVRSGIVNQNGKFWLKNSETILEYSMPKILDEELKQPMGNLFLGPHDNPSIAMNQALESISKEAKIIAVGDVTVYSLQLANRDVWISVIDGMTHRKEWENFERIDLNGKFVINATNPPGMLTSNIFEACFKAISQSENITILVDGEEDLTPIPLILMAPLGTVLLYGQPNQGLVVREIDISAKRRARRFLDSFVVEGAS
ncbi:MAG: hypothetical protein CMB31_07375 [Euryarchaeota archaeon]|nr:hypothetical protein [Euryarchaeota archaeon]